MAAVKAVDALLQQLADQHRYLMDEVAEQSLRVLRAENQQLTEQLAEARGLNERSTKRSAPPLPRLPSNLDAFESALLEMIETEATSECNFNSAQDVHVLFGNSQHTGLGRSRKAPKMPSLVNAPPSTDLPPTMDVDLPGTVHVARDTCMDWTLANGDGASTRQHAEPVLPNRLSKADSAAEMSPEVHTASRVSNGNKHLGMKRSGIRPAILTSMSPLLALDDIDHKAKHKQRRKFCLLFDLSSETALVYADSILRKARERCPGEDLYKADVMLALDAYKDMSGSLDDESVPKDAIALPVLAEATLQSDIVDHVEAHAQEAVATITKALNTTTVDDVIDYATKASKAEEALPRPAKASAPVWEVCLTAVVSVTVVLNIFFMGVSIDLSPDHFGWLAFEFFCTLVFLAEAILKLWHEGAFSYVAGPAAHWNILDLIITSISIFEVSLDMALRYGGDQFSEEGRAGEAMRIAVMLRVLRMVRIIRLMKLLRSPFLRDLANMLVGFVIGLPSLFWVLVLFLIVLYMLGLLFRITLGPGPGQDLIGQCGYPDDHSDPNDAICKIHWMYGEEFFYNVKISMFTTFRFMIGDYSTRGGKSLAVAFSQGYGDFFHVVFCVGMIFAIFGLFNIITAIFVDSTISGLKHNDVKRKYARQYERAFVKDRLRDLLERVAFLVLAKKEEEEERKKSLRSNTLTDVIQKRMSRVANFGIPARKRSSRVLDSEQLLMLSACNIDELELTEETFLELLDDEFVKEVLQDLDVDTSNRTDLFCTFDPDESGTVTVPEMVQAVLKLRGEPAKNDMISAVVSIRLLHEKFDGLRTMCMEMMRAAEQDVAMNQKKDMEPC